MIARMTMPDDGQPVAHEAPQGRPTGRVMLDGDDLDRRRRQLALSRWILGSARA